MAKPNTAGSKKNTAQKGTLKKVLKYVQRHGFFMVLSILFAAITVALTLYTPILIGDAIDLIVGKGQVDFAGIAAILIKTRYHHRYNSAYPVAHEHHQQPHNLPCCT